MEGEQPETVRDLNRYCDDTAVSMLLLGLEVSCQPDIKMCIMETNAALKGQARCQPELNI